MATRGEEEAPPLEKATSATTNAKVENDPKVRKYEVTRDYTLGRTLGKGSFAKVVMGTSVKKPFVERAVKIIDVNALSQSDVEALDLEIQTMRRVSHHNIVALHEIYSYDSTLVMVLELCKGGELFDRIVEKTHYSEREARVAFAQMVEAIGHCHVKGVVHRDLKPENLLYADSEGPNAETIKLADFGLASLLSETSALTTACGTPGYVSPEILTASKRNGVGYGKECDLWSLGVILFILLCGYPPFYDENNSVIFKLIKAGDYCFASPYWDGVSNLAKDLVSKLLTVDPKKRITANAVFDHPWMKTAEVSTLHLPHFVDNMNKYNLRRKFKASVLGVIAKRRLSKGFFTEKPPVVTDDTPQTETPPPAAAPAAAAPAAAEVVGGGCQTNPVVENPTSTTTGGGGSQPPGGPPAAGCPAGSAPVSAAGTGAAAAS